MSATPVFFATPKFSGVQIVNADGTALKTIHMPTSAAKIVAVMCAGDDTGTKDVQLVVTKGGVDYPLGTKTIAITAGTIAATPAVNLLDRNTIPGLPVDSDGQPYLLLEVGAVLKAKVLVAVTAAKTLSITAMGAEL